MPFSDILGHERQVSLLRNAILSQSVSHAYLFYGQAGVGKKLVADTFAQALNCEAEDGDSCGQCRSCRNIQKGNHPDVVFLQPEEGYIRIEEIRAVQNALAYKAFEGGWKVAIVDGCGEMSVGAANAFLKTLEEPPGNTTIILICPNHLSLLPTILSRCQTIRFSPLQDAEIQDILLRERELDLETADSLAALADGSPGLALSMDLDTARETRNEAFDLIFNNDAQDVVDLFSLSKKTSGFKETLPELLGRMMVIARDVAVWHATENKAYIKNKDALPRIADIAKRLTPAASLKVFDAISETLASLKWHANPQLAMDHLLIQIRTAA